MTHEELAELAYSGRVTELYPYAFRYIRLVWGQLRRERIFGRPRDPEDALQAAIVAAMEGCRSWDPLRCLFGSWVAQRVRSGLLDYARRERSGMIGGRDSRTAVVPLGSLVDELTGIPRVGVPEHAVQELQTDDDVDEHLDLALQSARLREAVSRLPPEQSEAVRRIYGIECLPETQEEYAARTGIPYRTVKWRLAEARSRLALFLKNPRYVYSRGGAK